MLNNTTIYDVINLGLPRQRMDPTDIKCTLPYRQIHFNSRGVFGPCCQFFDRDLFAGVRSIKDYLSSNQLIEIKEKLNNSEKIENCKVCWNQERSGIPSMRQRSLGLDPTHITEVFITFGNQCNTACRICNANRSSLIGKYDKQYRENTTDSDLKRLLSIGNNPWDNGKTWYRGIALSLVDMLEDLEVIQISGGEPFINAHFDEFIDTLIESGKSLPIIKITTNGSFTSTQINKLSQFKKVKIFFSVDGVNKEFYEYLRWPLKYDDLLEKIKILKEATYSNLSVNFQIVMHNLNLTHLYDAIIWFQQEFADDLKFLMTFTVLNFAEWYSIQNSPRSLRDREIEKISTIDWNSRISPTKDKIINYINIDRPYANLNMLKQHIKYTDSYRNLNSWEFLGWHLDNLIEEVDDK